MNDDLTWTVTYLDAPDNRTTERVVAECWQIGPNGDLAFGNQLNSQVPFFTRAFAAGTWLEVSLYA